MGLDEMCESEPCRRSATPGQGLAHPSKVCFRLDRLRHPSTPDGMVWDGMGWDGDLMGLDGTGRDEMRWDGMRCVSRSRAAGAPRLAKGWHTQIVSSQ